LGDAVLSLYALRAFQAEHPGVRVEMFCSERIREVYEDAPWIDAVHSLPVTGRRLLLELLSPRFAWNLLRTLRRLRNSRFDWLIDLELYRGHGPALKRLLGIPYSRGFHVEGLEPPAHVAPFLRGRLAPEWRCFYGVFGLPAPEALPDPLYALTPSPGASASGGGVKEKTIGVVFGSSFNWPEKKWPLEYFATVLAALRQAPVRFVLFGAGFEAGEGKRLLEAAPERTRSTVGNLDFRALRRELAVCDLVFGNDTGTLHVAAACGVPTVALFGPTPPEKWKPLTAEALWVDGLACRPCYYLGAMPECDHYSCLRKLRPERVAAAILDRIGSPG
jgi:ADP-heptose:LPS heptosyltransferase